jgi:phosphotriesterase-related protein
VADQPSDLHAHRASRVSQRSSSSTSSEDAGVKPDRVRHRHLGNLSTPTSTSTRQSAGAARLSDSIARGGNGDAQAVPLVMSLIDAGFADHLMFSADGGSLFAKTLTVFVPKLKAAGASDEVLHRIMVDNPRRFLACVAERAQQNET